MTDNLKEQAIKAINASGYTLELFVDSIMSRKENAYWYNQYFNDFDTGQPRSVDFVVPLGKLDSYVEFDGLVANLVIECKKQTKHAWIFLKVLNYFCKDLWDK